MYKFKCDRCDAGYIGFTTRHLYQRMEEHKYSAVGKHLKEHEYSMDCIEAMFTILKKCNNKLNCLIYETLFIREHRPTLNIQSDSLKVKVFP